MASTRHTGEISSKLSKKVAELTVVVHMLFKRNHEKEVEYEYFKLLVEKEIQKINESYHKQIGWLEKQLEEQESYRAKVEYKLGDAQNLEEKIIALEKQNEETKQQVFAKEDLLKIANLEIGVLKQKLESYEDDLDTMKTNNDFLLKKPQEMDRNSKSATQLQVSKSVHSIDKDSEELERKINFLEDEIERMKSNHENELTKSYAEKIALQQKIDAYNSSLSKEIVSLKETLTTLSSKQANDQKNISELEKKNNKLQESLKKAENDKKTLQKDAKALRDQLKNAIKDGYNKHNLLPIEKAVSQEARIKRYLESRDEELEKLKREIHMYRKELENREGNFNRMFAEKQPVILNSNPEGYLLERNLTGTRRQKQSQLPRLKEQRSLTFVSGQSRTFFQY